MNDWIDITRPVDEDMICWPGRKPPRKRWDKRLSEGHHCNVSSWEISAHCGTHIDAPLHFQEGGDSIDRIPPVVLIGECRVIGGDLDGETTLGLDAVSECGLEPRVLIRTLHSRANPGDEYGDHQQLLTPEAASFLVDQGVVLIGTDRLSVDDSKGESYALHHLLLESGCVLLEGLNLEKVEPGRYFLHALPLRLAGAEASPARAFLSPQKPNQS